MVIALPQYLFGEGLKIEHGWEVEARVDLFSLKGVEVHLEAVQMQYHVGRQLSQNRSAMNRLVPALMA